MSDEKDNAKPCPWCGGTSFLMLGPKVVCATCNASGPNRATRAEAVDAWNRISIAEYVSYHAPLPKHIDELREAAAPEFKELGPGKGQRIRDLVYALDAYVSDMQAELAETTRAFDTAISQADEAKSRASQLEDNLADAKGLTDVEEVKAKLNDLLGQLQACVRAGRELPPNVLEALRRVEA